MRSRRIALVALALAFMSAPDAPARVLQNGPGHHRYYLPLLTTRESRVHFTEPGWYQVGENGFPWLAGGPYRYVEQCRAWLPVNGVRFTTAEVRFVCERLKQKPEWDFVVTFEYDFD